MANITFLLIFVLIGLFILFSPRLMEKIDKKLEVQPHYDGEDTHYVDGTGYSNFMQWQKLFNL